MKTLIALPVTLGLAISIHALPTYDTFSSYGPTGTVLGGNPNTDSSGESWLVWTNISPPLDDFPVIITNYFSGSGSSDAYTATLPTGFPGPHQTIDTAATSVWVPPGGAMLGSAYLGDRGAVLKLTAEVAAATGQNVFASFFLDYPVIPAITGTSLRSGFMGFLPNAVVSSLNSTYQYNAPYCPEAPAVSQGSPVINNWFGLDWRGNQSGAATGGILGVRDGQNVGDSATTVAAAHINFIVITYQWGASTDVEGLWLNPAKATFAATTQPAYSKSRTGIGPSALSDAAGFFLQSGSAGQSTQLPASGIVINSLRIGTNWAYVTGGLQNVAAGSVTAVAGQNAVLNAPLAAAGVAITPALWANSSGPCNGGRYSVNATTGALTITGVMASDADTYSVTATTPIASENSVAPVTAINTVPLTVLTSEDASAIGSSQFTLKFTGPVGVGYRVWATTNFTLVDNPPVIPGWTQVGSGTYASGVNTFTDSTATSTTKYYAITVP